MGKINAPKYIAKMTISIIFAFININCALGFNQAVEENPGIAPTITYKGTPYLFVKDTAIPTVTPELSGDKPSSCSSSPALPEGLSIDATTCVISGTPTTVQGATSYTITATNETGNGTSDISIAVSPYAPGTAFSNTVNGVSFQLMYVPGGLTTPTGYQDLTTTTLSNAFEIAETEVTHELWILVKLWAMDISIDHDGDGLTWLANSDNDVYSFANIGTMGDGTGDTNQHPVSGISWRDAMVWCNALTEYYNKQNGTTLEGVYYVDAIYSILQRNASDTACGLNTVGTITGDCDNPNIKSNAKGFRLSTRDEWELAARYKGADSSNGAIEVPAASGHWWTPGNYASGAIANVQDTTATGAVAVHAAISTSAVKSKSANALGLFDMSGNVHEWNFDWYPTMVGQTRVVSGGSWNSSPDVLPVGSSNYGYPYTAYSDVGFRLARTP